MSPDPAPDSHELDTSQNASLAFLMNCLQKDFFEPSLTFLCDFRSRLLRADSAHKPRPRQAAGAGGPASPCACVTGQVLAATAVGTRQGGCGGPGLAGLGAGTQGQPPRPSPGCRCQHHGWTVRGIPVTAMPLSMTSGSGSQRAGPFYPRPCIVGGASGLHFFAKTW